MTICNYGANLTYQDEIVSKYSNKEVKGSWKGKDFHSNKLFPSFIPTTRITKCPVLWYSRCIENIKESPIIKHVNTVVCLWQLSGELK